MCPKETNCKMDFITDLRQSEPIVNNVTRHKNATASPGAKQTTDLGQTMFPVPREYRSSDVHTGRAPRDDGRAVICAGFCPAAARPTAEGLCRLRSPEDRKRRNTVEK